MIYAITLDAMQMSVKYTGNPQDLRPISIVGLRDPEISNILEVVLHFAKSIDVLSTVREDYSSERGFNLPCNEKYRNHIYPQSDRQLRFQRDSDALYLRYKDGVSCWEHEELEKLELLLKIYLTCLKQ